LVAVPAAMVSLAGSTAAKIFPNPPSSAGMTITAAMIVM
jgi:hypothetical protein